MHQKGRRETGHSDTYLQPGCQGCIEAGALAEAQGQPGQAYERWTDRPIYLWKSEMSHFSGDKNQRSKYDLYHHKRANLKKSIGLLSARTAGGGESLESAL